MITKFDSRAAHLVKKVLDEEVPELKIELEDVYRFTPIEISMKARGITVFALQKCDVTILVWVQKTKDFMIVRQVKKICW